MCSIAIPSELLLGHSPPVYGSLLYSSLMVTTPPISNRSVPPQIRPCLTSSHSLHLGLLNGGDDACIKRNKKRVVFADDRGRPLTQVRVMSEPSNMPPLWSSAYVASLARGELFRNLDGSLSISQSGSSESDEESAEKKAAAAKLAEVAPWEPSFAQPASDYLAFRNKLDKNAVSLENVIVREAEGCLIGTVKVKNITYDKEVTMRVTSDNWATQQDIACSYVEQPGLAAVQTAVRNLYDTFRFRIPLPKDSRQVEFCVRYQTCGQEFWDNNGGANYIVMKKREVTKNYEKPPPVVCCCYHCRFLSPDSPPSPTSLTI
ncbi:protein phosphatase 1 regulatory subunit 3C-like isoform X2 [Phymastichus coffea]|uniref:protein phosphatase 1 regulatory subunit 3C-like isoform X2 n=1 Tax=Phymastichus coffea TaxID=108790 RepID=UPI00273C4C43|nr:protein phosphatase 1 regulatory subunit 3C-like isoform X2 [Phymastichus coffea]